MAFNSPYNHENQFLFRHFTTPASAEVNFNSVRPSTIVFRNPIESTQTEQLSQVNPKNSNLKRKSKSSKARSPSSSEVSTDSFTDTDSSKPVSPIDLQTQEKIKLERKRQRNRVAASKCRKKKLEKISRLHERVVFLRKDNGELTVVRNHLRDNVTELKEQIMKHLQFGCNVKFTSPNDDNMVHRASVGPYGNSNLAYGKR